jgi:hypothetical protein
MHADGTERHTMCSTLRKIIGFAILGFLTITLSGPILALAGVALVGLAIYGVLKFLLTGHWPSEFAALRMGLFNVVRNFFRLILWPINATVGRVGRLGWGVVAWTARRIWDLGAISGEAVAGAVIGAALGVVVGMPTQWDHITVGAGAGVGALLGVWTGIANVWTARRRRQPMMLAAAPAAPSMTRAAA